MYLYRWNGKKWVMVGTGGGTHYDNYRLSV
jgi:hypothetical protein